MDSMEDQRPPQPLLLLVLLLAAALEAIGLTHYREEIFIAI